MSTGLLTIKTTADDFCCYDFIDDFMDDVDVPMQQVQAGFAGPLFGSSGNRNQVRIGIIRRLRFMDLDGREECLSMRQIENLPHSPFMAVIPQCDLIGQAALSQRVGKGGTHRAGANNHNFSRFPGSILHRSFSVAAHAFRGYPHVRRSLEFQTAV
jgi:hypothetical protein